VSSEIGIDSRAPQEAGLAASTLDSPARWPSHAAIRARTSATFVVCSLFMVLDGGIILGDQGLQHAVAAESAPADRRNVKTGGPVEASDDQLPTLPT
jgi:hypothetical protein